MIFDGDGGALGARLDDRQYVHLENVTVNDAANPVRADRSRGVVIRGCSIRPVNQTLGIVGIRAGACQDLLVEDNTVRMNGAWETIGRTGAHGYGGYGILVEGSGHVICHNTSISSRNAWYDTGIWNDVRFRNNLILGARPGLPALNVVFTAYGGDLDDNGWNRVGNPPSLVHWNGVDYPTLAAFAAATGNEAHGIEVTTADFAQAVLPQHPEWQFFETPYGAPYTPADIDLALASAAPPSIGALRSPTSTTGTWDRHPISDATNEACRRRSTACARTSRWPRSSRRAAPWRCPRPRPIPSSRARRCVFIWPLPPTSRWSCST